MNKELLKILAFTALYLAIVPVTVTNATGTIKKAYYSMFLEKTKGRVISSNIEKELKKGAFSSTLKTKYRAHITYIYSVERESFLGRGIEYEDPIFDTYSEAKTVIKRYPINRNVPIFYSTINPDKAVIIKPPVLKPLILLIIGSILTLLMTVKGAFFIMNGGIETLKENLKRPKKVAKPKEEKLTKKAPITKEKPKIKVAEQTKPTAKTLTAEPVTKTPIIRQPSKTQLKPKPTPEKVVIKKPTANPISTADQPKEARPKIVTSTSLKPSANKEKKPWYKF